MFFKKKKKALLLVALMTFLTVSCGTKPIHFNPNFYEFVTKDHGYIIDAKLKDKVFCDEPRIRKEFAALHISKIIELRKILREARIPEYAQQKAELLNEFQRILNVFHKTP